MRLRVDWLLVTRAFTQYVIPSLVALALTVEFISLYQPLQSPSR